MIRLFIVLLLVLVIGPAYVRTPTTPATTQTSVQTSTPKTVQLSPPTAPSTISKSPIKETPVEALRGWDYLASRLQAAGVPQETVRKIYSDKRFPRRTFVPFSVKPKEPTSMYRSFLNDKFSKLGVQFISKNKQAFRVVENNYNVPKEIVASIIVIESQAGKNTGKHPILYRLSRIATTNAPDNLRKNLKEARKKDPSVTFQQVAERGLYLEQTFLPEIIALIKIAELNKLDPLAIKGSRAGAFGLPQFLPTTYLRFGIDGNKDGRITLHNETDAVLSTAHFLSHYGLNADSPPKQKREILWRYNKSESYIETVLRLSAKIGTAMQKKNSKRS